MAKAGSESMLKKELKRMFLNKRGILLDRESNINFNVKLSEGFIYGSLKNSSVHITSMGNGCMLEYVIAYGDVRLGRYVSISGPGVILHAEDGKIEIGNFCSIGQNVSIQQFNHNIKRPSSFGMQHIFFGKPFWNDVDSKGDIIIEDDVWIGSNAVICSGVHIGRGAVIGAGAVVTKDVPSYSVSGGVPSQIIKMRFTQEQIAFLEESKWWTWEEEKILQNREFFLNHVGMKKIE